MGRWKCACCNTYGSGGRLRLTEETLPALKLVFAATKRQDADELEVGSLLCRDSCCSDDELARISALMIGKHVNLVLTDATGKAPPRFTSGVITGLAGGADSAGLFDINGELVVPDDCKYTAIFDSAPGGSRTVDLTQGEAEQGVLAEAAWHPQIKEVRRAEENRVKMQCGRTAKAVAAEAEAGGPARRALLPRAIQG